jgi:hypothetical protein
MAEMGIIGLIAFLYLIIAAYINIAKMSRIMKDHNYRFLLLGYGGGFCLWLFMALTEASLYTPITAIFFFFYLGIFSGFHKLLKPEERL